MAGKSIFIVPNMHMELTTICNSSYGKPKLAFKGTRWQTHWIRMQNNQVDSGEFGLIKVLHSTWGLPHLFPSQRCCHQTMPNSL